MFHYNIYRYIQSLIHLGPHFILISLTLHIPLNLFKLTSLLYSQNWQLLEIRVKASWEKRTWISVTTKNKNLGIWNYSWRTAQTPMHTSRSVSRPLQLEKRKMGLSRHLGLPHSRRLRQAKSKWFKFCKYKRYQFVCYMCHHLSYILATFCMICVYTHHKNLYIVTTSIKRKNCKRS